MADEHDTCLSDYRPLFAADLLKGKVAFVTGGGSGICFRIAEMFMRHGADCAIASRKLDRVAEAATRLEAAAPGRSCLPVKMDVRRYEDVQAGIRSCMDRFGRIDIVVNGAAGNFLAAAAALSANAFRTVMEIDTLGTFHVSKAAHEAWLGEHGGVILNITATLHYKGDMMQTHAGSAKAAVEAMSRHLANEWGAAGVRVNCLAPGPIEDTEGFRRLGGFAPPAVIARMKSSIPIGRFGTREEMGHAALFLCSDAAAYVTGASLVADGGQWFRSPAVDASGTFGAPATGKTSAPLLSRL